MFNINLLDKSLIDTCSLTGTCQKYDFFKKMPTQLKNRAFSELYRKELINLHHTAKFGVKRLKVKLIMNFLKDAASNYKTLYEKIKKIITTAGIDQLSRNLSE